MPAVQRLFVALDLPDGIRATLAADSDRPRDVAPDPRSRALHVTLAFLGNRPETDVDLIRPVIEAEHARPAARARPHPHRSKRVLARGDHGRPAAPSKPASPTALQAAGVYTPETRPFRPHVTLARLRPRTKPPRGTTLTLEPRSFHGEAVTLYASRLHPDGARYEALVTSRLGYIQP